MVGMTSSIFVMVSLISASLAKPNPLGMYKRLTTPVSTVVVNDAESYWYVVLLSGTKLNEDLTMHLFIHS